MYNRHSRRDVYFSWLAIAAIIGVFALPLKLTAQTNANHAPLFTSQAPTAITAGQSYEYTPIATDRDNNSVSYQLTVSPAGMKLSNSIISWQPTAAGTYNVAIEAADQQGGFAQQAWQITVSPSALASITIAPNDKPTTVDLNGNQTFTAKGFDQFNNEISGLAFTWTTGGQIGSINASGLFIPSAGGIGTVSAAANSITASAGVVVKDTRQEQVTLPMANSNANTSNSNTAAATVKNTNTNTNSGTDESISSADTNTAAATADEKTNETPNCTNWPHWLIMVMPLFYIIILVIYYKYERRHKASSWWIFPFLLTLISLIIYYKYFCEQTYLWWPWLVVGLGIVITLWYKWFRRNRPYDSTQTELPF